MTQKTNFCGGGGYHHHGEETESSGALGHTVHGIRATVIISVAIYVRTYVSTYVRTYAPSRFGFRFLTGGGV